MEKMTIEKALKFAEFELWRSINSHPKVISTLRLEMETAHAHVQSALNILNFG